MTPGKELRKLKRKEQKERRIEQRRAHLKKRSQLLAERATIVAKRPVWHDIPDWGDRTDCPLFKLPPEILDLCFGTELDNDLSVCCHSTNSGLRKISWLIISVFDSYENT